MRLVTGSLDGTRAGTDVAKDKVLNARSGAVRRGQARSPDLPPRIDHLDPASREVTHVPRGHGSMVGTGNRSNLAIELADRPPSDVSIGNDVCVGARSGAVERQDPVPKVLPKQAFNQLGKRGTSPGIRQHRHPMAQFRFAHGGEVDRRTVLHCKPVLDPSGGYRSHQFRDDVGVEDDHSSSDPDGEGSRTASRTGSSKSIRWDAATRARSNTGTYRGSEIAWRVSLTHRVAQDCARLLFHGVAVHGDAHSQAITDVVFKAADRDGRHGVTPRVQIMIALHAMVPMHAMQSAVAQDRTVSPGTRPSPGPPGNAVWHATDADRCRRVLDVAIGVATAQLDTGTRTGAG